MRKLTTTDISLQWIQPHGGKRDFELRSGNDVIAKLTWEKAFGTLATARTAEAAWSFKRVGFFNTRVTIRVAGSDADIGVFKPGWGYAGTLDVNGSTYSWKNIKFWGRQWGFFGPDGTGYVTFEYTGGLDSLLKLQGSVSLLPGAPVGRDMPLLLALGWYIMVMMSDDAAASAAVVAV